MPVQVAPPKRQAIRVAIVDDQGMVREGIRLLLSRQPDFDVIGEGEDGRDAMRLGQSSDVLLLELALPRKDSLEVIKSLASGRKSTRILVLTRLSSPHLALRTLRAGAAGYLRKESPSAELVSAIRAVHQGRTYIPSDLQTLILHGFRLPAGPEPQDRLSDRELQVLAWIASGYTNREIAARLTISVKTVDTHRGNILEKLALRNNSDLTRFAIQQGLLEGVDEEALDRIVTR